MAALVRRFYEQYRYFLPFMILLLTAFFLPTAGHRIVFYALVPVLLVGLYKFRAELGAYLKTRSFACLCLYLLYFGLSLFWSPAGEGEGPTKYLRDCVSILIFTLALTLAISKTRLEARDILLFASAVFVFTLVSLVLYVDVRSLEAGRLEGLGRYQNSIHLSFLLSLTIFALLCMGRLEARYARYLKYAFILVFLFFIAFTKTRSTLIALAGCVAMLGILGNRKLAGGLACLFLASLAGGFIIWDFSFSDIFQRADGNRLGVWQDAWEGVMASPLWGHGIGDSPNFHAHVERANHPGWKSAHNIFLGHWYTGGIVGLFIFIALLANMIWANVVRYSQSHKQAYVAPLVYFSVLSLCFVMLASMFNFMHYIVNVHIQWLVFWVPFCLAWYFEVLNAAQSDASKAPAAEVVSRA